MFPKYGVIIWSIMEIWPFACIKRNSILTSHTRWIHKKVQAIESNLNSTGDGSDIKWCWEKIKWVSRPPQQAALASCTELPSNGWVLFVIITPSVLKIAADRVAELCTGTVTGYCTLMFGAMDVFTTRNDRRHEFSKGCLHSLIPWLSKLHWNRLSIKQGTTTGAFDCKTYQAPLVLFWLWQGGVSYNMVQRPRNASNCTTKLFSLHKWSCQTLWIDVTNFYMVELIRQLAITTDLWPCLLRCWPDAPARCLLYILWSWHLQRWTIMTLEIGAAISNML